MKYCVCLFILGFGGLTAASASAADFRVVPGRSIGHINIGMQQAEVHKKLGTPTHVRRLETFVILETWLARTAVPQEISERKELKHHYLSIFYRERRVVQIEVSSPAFNTPDGLNTETEADVWKKSYPPSRTFRHTWIATDPNMGSPACKHLLLYEDAEKAGIGWKQGSWGCLSPEPGSKPEAVIVHEKGQPILLNPRDAEDYSGTVRSQK